MQSANTQDIKFRFREKSDVLTQIRAQNDEIQALKTNLRNDEI
jgi:hypothetical protein